MPASAAQRHEEDVPEQELISPLVKFYTLTEISLFFVKQKKNQDQDFGCMRRLRALAIPFRYGV
jgi:hypothetical protein